MTITLNELRTQLNELATHYDGELPVDIGVNTGGGGYRILAMESVSANARPMIGGPKPESIRIYTAEIRADIHAIRPVPTRRTGK